MICVPGKPNWYRWLYWCLETRIAIVVAKNPAITIDGCKLACAAKMVQQSGGTIAQEFAVLDVTVVTKTSSPWYRRTERRRQKLARVLAQEVTAVVDGLISGKKGGENA